MTRTARVSAATVAIRSSGQMMVVMIEAGTTMPPIPRPPRMRRPQARYRVSALREARAPQPGFSVCEKTCKCVSRGEKGKDIPAVMMTELAIINSLL